MVSILTGVVLEWVKLVPFLLIAFLVVEFVEHKASDKMRSLLSKSGRFGSVAGSALGAIPQCGFSVMAANLYYGRVITPGTLVAVFISTSDEAVPVLIANGLYSKTLQLILIKVMIGIVAGLLVDFILVKPLRINHPCDHRHDLEHLCSDCGCKDGIIKSAIYHTIKISLFILAFILVFNLAVHFIGEENFSKIIL